MKLNTLATLLCITLTVTFTSATKFEDQTQAALDAIETVENTIRDAGGMQGILDQNEGSVDEAIKSLMRTIEENHPSQNFKVKMDPVVTVAMVIAASELAGI